MDCRIKPGNDEKIGEPTGSPTAPERAMSSGPGRRSFLACSEGNCPADPVTTSKSNMEEVSWFQETAFARRRRLSDLSGQKHESRLTVGGFG
jgi:hypothetical protein